ncbi:GspH/FimT family pseudopilin [Dyella sp. C9]|uniref:GspH/FimT family pseudopilin n=1 Tax=Dyella sp. C9 TaxID=2202154 RepID=UPI001300B894|nr:GspH/FimT family pseudopilin [Dyella sp. C9]
MLMRRTRAGGYGVIEMLVVLVIAAIILAYAVPAYKSLITQNRMGGEINDLQGDLELSRSSAIKQGVPVVICPSSNPTATTPSCSGSTSWQSGWIVFTDIGQNQTYAADSGDTLLHVHSPLQLDDTLTGSVSETANGAFGGTLTYLSFNRMGAPSLATPSKYAALSVHDANSTVGWYRCVIVSIVGTTTLQPPGSCP